MSSTLSPLSTQLAAAEQYSSSVLQPALTEVDVKVAALEALLLTARTERDRVALEVTQITERITDLRTKIKELTPVPSGRIWRVSDNHSYCPHGDWALEATESSSYGVCVSSSYSEGSNTTFTIGGTPVEVSTKRYNAAKDIHVGDTLFMGDGKRNAVFKGTVTGQSVKGIFKSNDPSINSFRRRMQERASAAKHSLNGVRDISDEVEMMWEVKWERVGTLTKAWKEYLHYSQRITVRPLSNLPSF